MKFLHISQNIFISTIIVLVFTFLISCQSAMQSGSEAGGLTWKNKLKIADKFYNEGYFYDASHYYEEVLVDQPENIDVTYKLAESYFLSRDYKMANQSYKIVMEKNIQLYPLSHYKYALTLKMTGQYVAAKKEFELFGKKYRAYDAPLYKKKVKIEIAGCDFAIKAMENPQNVMIVHVGKEINAAYTEAAPMPIGDDVLIYASLRSDTLIASENLKGKVGKFMLYQAKRENRKWGQGEPLPAIINAPRKDVANGAFAPDCACPDGSKFFFTQCEANDAGKMICEIYSSDFKDGVWSNVKKLDEAINIPGFTSTHPTVGEDKKRGSLLLYFSSDRPDGVGGMDLWYSEITKDGVYKAPRNLGKKVNTVNDELTPYFNVSSNMLSFSSNGHPSIGGYDIFYTSGKMRKWTKPENAGYPINSVVDDMYFVSDDDEEGGYFVSNRKGAIALKSETCCDDIFRYSWDRDMIPKFAIDGFAYNADDSTRTSFQDYDIKLFQIEKDSSEILINEKHITDESEFFFTIKRNKNYKLLATKEGYFPNDAFASTVGLTKSDTLHREIPLKKLELNQAIVLKDVYYDFDKATLREESSRTLNMLVDILNVNPGIVVELSSHTDSKGNDLYNEKLSQRRAESVVKFLRKAGISKDRLVPKGYGEKHPIADNTNPDGSDNPQGRQMNRRTEIKVIGETEITVHKKKANLDDALKGAEGE